MGTLCRHGQEAGPLSQCVPLKLPRVPSVSSSPRTGGAFTAGLVCVWPAFRRKSEGARNVVAQEYNGFPWAGGMGTAETESEGCSAGDEAHGARSEGGSESHL